MASKNKKEQVKEYDVRKQGPLSYRKLQEQNAALASQSTFTAQEPIIIPRSAFQYEGYEQSPLMQQGTGDYWGNSIYDENSATTDEWEDLNEVRAENQPWYAKLGAGVVKGLGNAATSFLSGTVGLAYGAVSASNGGSFWDNDFNKAMDDFNQALEEELPNYYTRDEIENPLAWRNIFSANTLGDKLIKNLGFAVGMVYGGGVISGALKATRLPRLLTKLTRSAKAGRALTSLVSSTAVSAGEANMESYRGAAEQIKAQTSMVEMEFEDQRRSLMEAYKEEIENNDATAINIVNAKLQEINEREEQALAKIKEDGRKAGDDIWLGNMAVLMPSNLIQFGKVFSRGFMGARGTLSVAGTMGQYTKNIGKGTLAYNLTKGAISEGMEEISQGAITRGTANYYEKDLNNFMAAQEDPDAKQETLNMMSEITNSLVESFASDEGKEEFLLGAVTGALGIPVIGRRRSGRIGPKLEGGIFSEIADYRRQSAAETFMANQLNNRANDPKFKSYYEGLVRHNKYEGNKRAAIIENDKEAFEDSDNAQLISDIIMFDSVGKLGDLESMVKFQSENLSDEELEQIVTDTSNIDTTDGRITDGVFTEQQGDELVPMTSSDRGKQEMRETIKNNATKVINTINQYKKTASNIDIETEGTLSDKQLQELTFMALQNDYWRNQQKENIEAVKSIIYNYPEVAEEGSALAKLLQHSPVEILSSRVSTAKKAKALRQVEKNNPGILQEVQEEMSTSVGDTQENFLQKIIDAQDKIDTYDKKFEEYKNNPEVQIREQENKKEEAAQQQKKKEAKDIKKKLQESSVGDLANDDSLISQAESIFGDEHIDPAKQVDTFEPSGNLFDEEIEDKSKGKIEQAKKVQKAVSIAKSKIQSLLQGEEQQEPIHPVEAAILNDIINSAASNVQDNAEELLDRQVLAYQDSESAVVRALQQSPAFQQAEPDVQADMVYSLKQSIDKHLDTIVQHMNQQMDNISNLPNEGSNPVDVNNQGPENKPINPPKSEDPKLPAKQGPIVVPPELPNYEVSHPSEQENFQFTPWKSSTPRLPIKSIFGDMTPWHQILSILNSATNKLARQQEKRNNNQEPSTEDNLTEQEQKYYDFYKDEIEDTNSVLRKYNMLSSAYIKRARTIYEYLDRKGAFEAVDSGQVQPGDDITFVIDKELSEEVGSPVILLAKIDGNQGITIVGDFAANKAIKNFTDSIIKEYQTWKDKEGSSGIFISSYSTKVKNNYLGRIPFSPKEERLPLNTIFPKSGRREPIIIGIVTDSLGSIKANNTDINSNRIRRLKNPVKGQPVVLIQTSDRSKGSTREYVPVPFIMATYSEETANTQLGKAVDYALDLLEEGLKDDILGSESFLPFKDAIVKVLSLSREDFYIDLTNDGIRIRVKKPNEDNFTTINIPRDENIRENVKSQLQQLKIPFQVNLSMINDTTVDGDSYNRIIGEIAETNLHKGATHTVSDFFSLNTVQLQVTAKGNSNTGQEISKNQVQIKYTDGRIFTVNTDTWDVYNDKNEKIEDNGDSKIIAALNKFRAFAYGIKTGQPAGSIYDTDWGKYDSSSNKFITSLPGQEHIDAKWDRYQKLKARDLNEDNIIDIINAIHDAYKYNNNQVALSELGTPQAVFTQEMLYEFENTLVQFYEMGYSMSIKQGDRVLSTDPISITDDVIVDHLPAGKKVVRIVHQPTISKNGNVVQQGRVSIERSKWDSIEHQYQDTGKVPDYGIVVFNTSNPMDTKTSEALVTISVPLEKNSLNICINTTMENTDVANIIKSEIQDQVEQIGRAAESEDRSLTAQEHSSIKQAVKESIKQYLQNYKQDSSNQEGNNKEKVGNNIPSSNAEVSQDYSTIEQKLKKDPQLIKVFNALSTEQKNQLAKKPVKAKGKLQQILAYYDIDSNSITDEASVQQIISGQKNKQQQTTEKPSKESQVKKEVKWFQRVLPNLSRRECITIVENMLDIDKSNFKAWGRFTNGIIQVFKNATKGTVYHEAFHAVVDMLLSEQEKNTLFEEASKAYPKLRNHPLALEEALAEDFRRYTQKMEIPFIGPVIKTFRKLKMVCGKLKNKHAYLDNLYFRINNGDYGKRSVLPSSNTVRNSAEQRYKDIERELAYAQEEIKNIRKTWNIAKSHIRNGKGHFFNMSKRKYLTYGQAVANIPAEYSVLLDAYEYRGRYHIEPKRKEDIQEDFQTYDNIIEGLKQEMGYLDRNMEALISEEALSEQESKYRVARVTGVQESKVDSNLLNSVTSFFRAFNITLKQLDSYDSSEPIFDRLNKVIYYRNNKDITEQVGHAIAFMMQHDPIVTSIFWKKSPVFKILFKAAGLFKNKNSIRAYLYRKLPSKNIVLKGLGYNIAKELQSIYGLEGFQDTTEKNSSIINSFFQKLSNMNKSLYDTIASYSRNAANSVYLNDPSVVVSSFKKPGTDKDTSRVSIDQALLENPYEEAIIHKLSQQGFAIAGSAALALTGTVFRPSENPLHDIDFQAKGKTREEVKNAVNSISKNNKLIRTISNPTGPTLTYLVLDRPFEVIRPVKGTAVYQLIDPKTKKPLGSYVGSELTLNKGVQGKFLDFFLGERTYDNYTMRINNKDYLVGNEKYALEAKIDWQRDKDIWDYSRYIPEELYQQLELEQQLEDEKLSSKIQESKVIWGHPAIGKTTYLENRDDIIEWDKEVNPKRNKFIQQQIDPLNQMDEYTYNRAKREYMKSSHLQPEYAQFLKEEWEALKQKASKEGKKIFASPLPLLRLFPQDFDLVINLDYRTFVRNNQNRGGHLNSTIEWKYAINEVLTTIPSSKVYTTGKYLSELAPSGMTVHSKYSEIQQYHNSKNMYDNLSELDKQYLQERKISKEEFDSWSPEEREVALHCKA